MKKIFLLGFALLLWGCGNAPVENEEVRDNQASQGYAGQENEELVLDVSEVDEDLENFLDEISLEEPVLEIVEYFDYSCPHCRVMQEALANLKQKLGDQIEITSYPLVVYGSSRGAALASECARDQKLWDGFHQSLFALQGSFNEQTIPALVHDLGLDKELFSACIASGTKKKVLAEYQAKADSHDITGTPSFLINGKTVISGGYPPQIFEAMIRNMVGE